MMSQETNNLVLLKDNIAPSFYALHWSVLDEEYGQYWLSGGRGSTKSSFIAIEIVLGIMNDPEANAVCFRKVSNTIRDSLYSTFVWAISVLGVSDKWKPTVAPFEFVYLPTGQKIILKGLDDPQKMKSVKVAKGYFKYLWFEELAEFSGMEEIRNVQQSVLRGGEIFVEFLSYNPPRDPQAWVNKEREVINNNRYVHHSTYLDVPENWLGSRFIDDANRLKEHDDVLYQCEYMGLSIGLTDSVVFNGKYIIQDFKPQEWWSCLHGADWGFANDPNVLVKIWIAPHNIYGDNCLYIEYEAYGFKVDNNLIPELFDKIPDSRKYLIRADCSRPETISYIRQKGFNIIGAEKWGGSVEDGIAFIRSFDKIIIHPRCSYMTEEARLYSYKIDKLTKEILPKLVDGYDHGWDAVRYALQVLIKERLTGFTKEQVKRSKKAISRNIAPRENEQSW